MKRIKRFGKRLSAISAEILLISGAFFIVGATASISITAAAYVVGALLMVGGIFVALCRR